MSTERSDKLYEASREEDIKFDYFMLGVIGAFCAFIGQSFHPTKLGWNPSTLELLALLMLIASAVAGFHRIERISNLIRMNGHYLRSLEEKGMLMGNLGHSVINEATGDIYSSAHVATRIARLTQNIPDARAAIDRLGNATLRAYRARNSLLLLGALLLLTSRVWAAYIPVAGIGDSSSHPAITAGTLANGKG